MNPPVPPLSRRRFLGLGLTAAALPALASPGLASPEAAPRRAVRPRLRDLGIVIGELPAGAENALTDVPGVRVGHATLIHGQGPLVVGSGPVRTGVTAVLPRPELPWRRPVFAADLTINGNGELTGLGPVRRTGVLAAPVLLTDTGSVGRAYDGAVGWILDQDPAAFDAPFRPDPVVGETWAGFLHDTAGRHLGPAHVARALAGASGGPVAEGSVGGGTGMRAFQFKAGIGTASRRIAVGPGGAGEYTVGVLVQANFGRRPQLRVKGVPVGRLLSDRLPERGGRPPAPAGAPGNSLLMVVATDAPLIPVQLQRLCKRALVGMARTGGISTHGSGDLAIAFSTGNDPAPAAEGSLQILHYSHMSRLFAGVVEAAEEAILNALTAAGTMVGRDGNTIHGLPLEEFVEVMERYGEAGGP